ncbi:hypothetical protein VSDKYIMU_CDS0189 [Enterococcus phage VRE9_4]
MCEMFHNVLAHHISATYEYMYICSFIHMNKLLYE